MSIPGRTVFVLFAAAVAGATGCARAPVNPSFALSPAKARTVIEKMADEPKALERPLVVIGGYHDPGWGAWLVSGRMREILGDRDGRSDGIVVVDVAVGYKDDFDACRDAVIEAVDRQLGRGPVRGQTREVDVLGLSMGGLVARHAALPREDGRRLNVARLFTIATPHRGARLADFRLSLLPVWDQKVLSMTTASPFLADLVAAERAAWGDGAGLRHAAPRVEPLDAPLRADDQATDDSAAGGALLSDARLAHFALGGGGGAEDVWTAAAVDDAPAAAAEGDPNARAPDADAPRGYPIYPYVRLGDIVVGPENAAPAGQSPWWVHNPPLRSAHLAAAVDDRILADIARRLRRETPFAQEPPAPLPDARKGGPADPQRDQP